MLENLMNSPPSFQQSSAAQGRAESGAVYSNFTSGDFAVGGMKINWYVILAGLAILYVIYKKK